MLRRRLTFSGRVYPYMTYNGVILPLLSSKYTAVSSWKTFQPFIQSWKRNKIQEKKRNQWIKLCNLSWITASCSNMHSWNGTCIHKISPHTLHSCIFLGHYMLKGWSHNESILSFHIFLYRMSLQLTTALIL